MPSESNNRQKDMWDKFQIVAQAVTAAAASAIAILLGLDQQKSADATLQLARSNFELAKIQVQVSLLPSLLSEDAKQRTMGLSLAKRLDEKFANDVARDLARSDEDEGVREEARVISESYDIVNELRALGLLKKLQEARGYVEGGSPNGNEEALNLYDEVLKQLSESALKKLDRALLMDAQEDQKGGYKEHAARKYRTLFQDYEGVES